MMTGVPAFRPSAGAPYGSPLRSDIPSEQRPGSEPSQGAFGVRPDRFDHCGPRALRGPTAAFSREVRQSLLQRHEQPAPAGRLMDPSRIMRTF